MLTDKICCKTEIYIRVALVKGGINNRFLHESLDKEEEASQNAFCTKGGGHEKIGGTGDVHTAMNIGVRWKDKVGKKKMLQKICDVLTSVI